MSRNEICAFETRGYSGRERREREIEIERHVSVRDPPILQLSMVLFLGKQRLKAGLSTVSVLYFPAPLKLFLETGGK